MLLARKSDCVKICLAFLEYLRALFWGHCSFSILFSFFLQVPRQHLGLATFSWSFAERMLFEVPNAANLCKTFGSRDTIHHGRHASKLQFDLCSSPSTHHVIKGPHRSGRWCLCFRWSQSCVLSCPHPSSTNWSPSTLECLINHHLQLN